MRDAMTMTANNVKTMSLIRLDKAAPAGEMRFFNMNQRKSHKGSDVHSWASNLDEAGVHQ
jgi:hypothetical protein